MTKNYSNTGIPTNPVVILFEGDPSKSFLHKSFVETIPGFNLGYHLAGFDVDGSSEEVDSEDLDEIEDEFEDDKTSQDDEEDGSVTKGLKAPSLSDIKLISNTIVGDIASRPSSTVVIRVTNSSGVTLKAIRAKVGKAS